MPRHETAEPTLERGDAKRHQGRRRLLTSLAAGGVVAGAQVIPDRWIKPVVDVVVVPAHAQASGLLPDGTSTINQLLAINSGQFFYSEIGVPLSAGTASIFVNIDFGARTIGGGNSRLTVNVPGNVSFHTATPRVLLD